MTFEADGERSGPLRLALPGRHQHDNAALAFAALLRLRAQGFELPMRAVRHALTRVRWPARLEWLAGRPRVLLDAAHNPDGCRALVDFIARQPQRPRVLIFGALLDKEYRKMLRLLAPHFDSIVYVRANLPRAVAPADLQRIAAGEPARTAAEALRYAKRAAGSGGIVVVAGSIFVVAELRARLLRVGSDPLIRL